jgi:hypothetical protein
MPSKAVGWRLEGRAHRSDHAMFVTDDVCLVGEGDPQFLGDQQSSVALDAPCTL